MKIKILLVVIFVLVVAGIMGCLNTAEESPPSAASIKTYLDIPGLTAEEIAAIEEFKSTGRSFSHGTTLSEEMYVLQDGSHTSFATMSCELLTGLFGIPFEPEIYDWLPLKDDLDNYTIDFTGELITTPEHRQTYYMTSPIEGRSLVVYFDTNAVSIEKAEDLSGLRVGYFEGSITAQSILNTYRSITFATVGVKTMREAADKLLSQEIDAFVTYSTSAFPLWDYDSIAVAGVFPLVHIPIALSTANPDLAPVISVVDKYLAAGGSNVIHSLLVAGNRKHTAFELHKSFTDEEKAYIADLAADGAKVPIALEHDNYPVCFYNEQTGEFQGIAPEILAELSLLTGIEFEIITNKDTPWHEILEMLKTGEASMVSELLYIKEWDETFLWPDHSYYTSNYAFLSKLAYPDLDFYQVSRATVGIVRDTVFEEAYKTWFHHNNRHKLYDTQDDALDALERGDIDLLLTSDYILLYQTHYREKPGYKINIVIDGLTDEVFFGFNKNETTLCSILCKATVFIDTERIARYWTNLTFDYTKIIALQRLFYLTVFAGILALLLIILIILFIKNNTTRAMYKNKLTTLTAIYNALPDLVLCKDTNGAYTSCNHNFEKLTGIKETELIGKTAPEIDGYLDRISGEYIVSDQKVFQGKATVKTKSWLSYPDGSRKFFETVKAPLIQDGKVTGLVGICKDVTDLYEALEKADEAIKELITAKEQAEQGSRTKSDFLAKVSHEIRTPMNAIIGLTELALKEEMSNTARDHVITVKHAGVNLLSIINDILDFSKIESGNMQIIPAVYYFSSLINDVISIIRMRAIDSQIRFAVYLDSNLPNTLIGDEIRIRQILINILGNAVKYTDKGFVTITISGETIDENSLNLIMEIKDSGRGIKEDEIGKLFKNYFQLDMKTNKGVEGVGLGLVISMNIVKGMEGDITVHSEYGKGSTFTVTLPQKIHSREKLAEVENPDKLSAILLERREIYSDSIYYTVTNLGLRCRFASDVDDFRRMMETDSFSFIFVSHALFETNKAIILQLGGAAQIVLLAEFGESLPIGNWSVLSMPAHAITVANVINGVSDRFSYNTGDEITVRFTAPEAKALVVDDINTNLKVTRGLLAPYYMHVDVCNSGAKAIETIKSKDYDIVFMDHRMPEMDGVEAVGHIRAMGGQERYYKSVPIIALTANAVSGVEEMFLQCGFDDYLSKPIDTVKLNSILEKWLPAEKKTGYPVENNKGLETGPPAGALNIEGLDVKKGILQSGGTTGYYYDTLAAFYKDGWDRIPEIRKCLDTGDLSLYVTHIHALKGALANIGAGKLSEKAYVLELAGQRRDFGYINAGNRDFLTTLKQFLKDIGAAIDIYGTNRNEHNVPDTGQIKTELQVLKAAIRNMEAGTINQTVEILTKLARDDETKTIVRMVSNHILMAEYDEAEAIIDSMED